MRCSKWDYSITSSASASSVGGTSRPRTLAVLRLTTSSYLVGACTGGRPPIDPGSALASTIPPVSGSVRRLLSGVLFRRRGGRYGRTAMTPNVRQAIPRALAVCIAMLAVLFASSGANSQQPTTCYCICATTGGLWGELNATEPRGCPALVGKACSVLDRATGGASRGRTVNCGPALFGARGPATRAPHGPSGRLFPGCWRNCIKVCTRHCGSDCCNFETRCVIKCSGPANHIVGS
jgi:hypothetical protein